ncbi:MAG: hypothetical protein JO013_13395 [Alphaproteobacteria bacterium]|nr:hypothetical protein [Alphaproteobacteria bacterium]
MDGKRLLHPRELQKRAAALAALLGHTDFALGCEPRHDGSAHLEIGEAYDWVVTERGQELERRRTTDPDELLYWFLCGLTSSMASDHEVRQRRSGEDPRRQLFAKEVALLEKLSPGWAARRRREQAETLARYPFADR